MNRAIVTSVCALALFWAAAVVAWAASQTIALRPGDSADVTCSTSSTVSSTPQKTHIDCATPVSSPVWLSPAGVTDIRRSQGYNQYCNAHTCGTSLGSDAFDCGGIGWNGEDDEGTFAGVGFPQPISVSGLEFWATDGLEPPGTHETFDFYAAMADSGPL